MCARWIQLATFYPFARHHYNLTWKGEPNEPNEPFRMEEPYQTYARNSIYDRYQYLRVMYTCLYEVSQSGGSCFDPLFYHYPSDDNLFDNIEESFLIHGALKVSPILSPDINDTYTSYFPIGTWVSMRNFSEIIHSIGDNITLRARDTVNVHLREGTLIPF
jgi:alpha-glucosidase (family GH31 glycosyl hydrolase)